MLDDAVLVEEVIVSDAWNGKRSSLRIVQVAGRVRGGFLNERRKKVDFVSSPYFLCKPVPIK